MLGKAYSPPSVLQNRTPEEFARQSLKRTWHQLYSNINGICQDCSGNIPPSVYICSDHTTEAGSVCDQCNRRTHIAWVFTCEHCKSTHRMWGYSPIGDETAVVMFFYERGLDLLNIDTHNYGALHDVIQQTEVLSEDPLKITVTAALDGDRLVVTLDEEANVIDVTEELA